LSKTNNMAKKKKLKCGAKLKYGVETITSSLRHPVSKKKYVDDIFAELKTEFKNEFKTK